MIDISYINLHPIINARYIEDGNGSGSWRSASASWNALERTLSDYDAQLASMSFKAGTAAQSEAGRAMQDKISEIRGQVSTLRGHAQEMSQKADAVGEAYDAANGSIIPSSEVEDLQRRIDEAKAAASARGPLFFFQTQVLGMDQANTTAGKAEVTAAQLERKMNEYRAINGGVLTKYATALSAAAPELEGMETKTSGGGASSGGPTGGYSAAGSSGASFGAIGGGVAGGARYGGSFGSGSFAGSRMPARTATGGARRYSVKNVDPIDIEKMLRDMGVSTSGQNYSGYGGPYGSGYPINLDPNKYGSSDFRTGLSYYDPSSVSGGYKSSYNPSTAGITSPSYASPSKMSNLDSLAGGVAGPVNSSSRVASTRLSNASASTPAVGLPGGLGGMSRFAGAGSMNPGAFRGSGVGNSPARLTGGLGMGAAQGTAVPGAGFGGVQTTPASQTPGRPPMGMMPMGGAGGAGGRGRNNRSEDNQVRSADTNIFADINAFGAQRTQEEQPNGKQ